MNPNQTKAKNSTYRAECGCNVKGGDRRRSRIGRKLSVCRKCQRKQERQN